MSRCRCRFHLGCTVHDEEGRRWDSYTAEEVARLDRQKVEPADPEWSCYCGRHEATDNELPAGTPCIWRRTSYEYDEAECECIESYRDRWLSVVTIDWDRLGHAEDRRQRRQECLRRWRWILGDFKRRWWRRATRFWVA